MQSSSVVSQMQQYKQKRGDDAYGDGPGDQSTWSQSLLAGGLLAGGLSPLGKGLVA